MKNVGFIGWRGMVGSVLMQRMVEERDFDAIRPVFFSTSQLGQPAPSFGGSTGGTLQDAFDLDALKALDIIVTCQGGDYTNEIYPKLRASGWQGYWIDAASSLRMKDDAIIILDPVNQDVITSKRCCAPEVTSRKRPYCASNPCNIVWAISNSRPRVIAFPHPAPRHAGWRARLSGLRPLAGPVSVAPPGMA